MPKSSIRTPAGASRRFSCWATSTPNPSSPRKMFPTHATRMLSIRRHRFSQNKRFYLFGGKEKSMARLTHQAQVASGIILQHDRKVDLIFKILFNGFDDGNLAG